MTYGALCRGLLSGRVTADRQYQGDDLRKIDPKFKPPRLDAVSGGRETAGRVRPETV